MAWRFKCPALQPAPDAHSTTHRISACLCGQALRLFRTHLPMCKSGRAPRLVRPALRRSTALILGNAPLEGEGERTFFAFFTLRCCKHTIKPKKLSVNPRYQRHQRSINPHTVLLTAISPRQCGWNHLAGMLKPLDILQCLSDYVFSNRRSNHKLFISLPDVCFDCLS
jgi:hypothetical protein